MSKAMIVKVPTNHEGVVVADGSDPLIGVVCGNNATVALRKAAKAGVREPVLFFVPDPNKRYVY